MVLHILYMSGAMGMYTSCTCMGKQHWYMTFVDICTCTELLRNVALDLSEAVAFWNITKWAFGRRE